MFNLYKCESLKERGNVKFVFDFPVEIGVDEEKIEP